jgi:hypothetical protein
MGCQKTERSRELPSRLAGARWLAAGAQMTTGLLLVSAGLVFSNGFVVFLGAPLVLGSAIFLASKAPAAGYVGGAVQLAVVLYLLQFLGSLIALALIVLGVASGFGLMRVHSLTREAKTSVPS